MKKKAECQVMVTITLDVYVPVKTDSLVDALEYAKSLDGLELFNKSDEIVDTSVEITGVFKG